MAEPTSEHPEAPGSNIEEGGSPLSPEAQLRAKRIVAAGTAAKESGDEAAVEALNQQILDDPELAAAIGHDVTQQPKEDSSQEQLRNIQTVLNELTQKVQRLIQLSSDVIDRRPMYSLLREQDGRDERRVFQGQLQTVTDAIENDDSEQIRQAIGDFSHWYNDRATPLINRRATLLRRYFMDNPPDKLRAQYRLFQEMEDDIRSLRHYSDML
ncbi:hypothetical protein KC686_02700 [Candidatus Woesebacteria bacterium]|nr:hypothetical protein [Candidatus Woesebacteria bacterium]